LERPYQSVAGGAAPGKDEADVATGADPEPEHFVSIADNEFALFMPRLGL